MASATRGLRVGAAVFCPGNSSAGNILTISAGAFFFGILLVTPLNFIRIFLFVADQGWRSPFTQQYLLLLSINLFVVFAGLRPRSWPLNVRWATDVARGVEPPGSPEAEWQWILLGGRRGHLADRKTRADSVCPCFTPASLACRDPQPLLGESAV